VSYTAIRPASSADLPEILRLLREADLPTEGVSEHIGHFFAAETGGRIVGAIGFEKYGHDALLRSAVVHRDYRSAGIGSRLYEALRAKALAMKLRKFVLLTTTAEGYFRARGFTPIDRSAVTGPMSSSVEFTTACPSSAVCMQLTL
jgi:amino-acid N-acetyltransferase